MEENECWRNVGEADLEMREKEKSQNEEKERKKSFNEGEPKKSNFREERKRKEKDSRLNGKKSI